ncbi:MAG TPA: alkaline phosphatase family protein [Pseudonocardiaceae bacterium]|nr:alkaline phosphatase family protein [Pseudonocardiaceae bacterium]
MVIAIGSPIPAAAVTSPVPHYDHIFVVVEENNGFTDIIGNKAAPNFNKLAQTYGLATNYFGVSHPSEPNYVAMLGGDTFGIADDNPYFINRVTAPSLMTQFDRAGISWKAYLQGVPHPGYQAICYPARCNGAPDSDPLYASKHNGVVNFASNDNPADLARQVPVGQLSTDLRTGNVPAFNYVIPDECHDEHGDPPACLDSGNIFDPQNQHLVAFGDRYLGGLVGQITGASFWSKGNNAIVVTYDEGDDNVNGGGQVPTVVITSHGPRGVQDNTLSSHFSLLDTIESSFGLSCLANACAATPLTPLLTVTGSAAQPYTPVATPTIATPSPTPVEPLSTTGITATRSGWTVVSSPLYGTGDNNLGAVAAGGQNDVWAVGSFLPDTATSNQDATLSLADHFNGTNWQVVPTPNTGTNFNTLFGVADAGGRAWAAGVFLDGQSRDRALMEAWNGTKWTVVDVPQPGSARDLFYGVSADSPTDVWAAGAQEGADGKYATLVEHFDGDRWTVVPSPDPGSTGNIFYAVTAVAPDDVYAVGQRLGSASDQGLVEHWDGTTWSVVSTPSTPGSTFLDGVTVGGGAVYAVGEDASSTGLTPVVLVKGAGIWRRAALPAVPSTWVDLYGVAVGGGRADVVGTDFQSSSGNNVPLLLTGTGASGWRIVDGPQPSAGTGSEILAGIADAGGTTWIAGTFDVGNNNLPLLQHN